MSGRHQPLDGADSAQSLADAIEYVESHGLTVTSSRSAVIIIPRCIACSEPALPGLIECAGHDRLGRYTEWEASGQIAANE